MEHCIARRLMHFKAFRPVPGLPRHMCGIKQSASPGVERLLTVSGAHVFGFAL